MKKVLMLISLVFFLLSFAFAEEKDAAWVKLSESSSFSNEAFILGQEESEYSNNPEEHWDTWVMVAEVNNEAVVANPAFEKPSHPPIAKPKPGCPQCLPE